MSYHTICAHGYVLVWLNGEWRHDDTTGAVCPPINLGAPVPAAPQPETGEERRNEIWAERCVTLANAIERDGWPPSDGDLALDPQELRAIAHLLRRSRPQVSAPAAVDETCETCRHFAHLPDYCCAVIGCNCHRSTVEAPALSEEDRPHVRRVAQRLWDEGEFAAYRVLANALKALSASPSAEPAAHSEGGDIEPSGAVERTDRQSQATDPPSPRDDSIGALLRDVRALDARFPNVYADDREVHRLLRMFAMFLVAEPDAPSAERLCVMCSDPRPILCRVCAQKAEESSVQLGRRMAPSAERVEQAHEASRG